MLNLETWLLLSAVITLLFSADFFARCGIFEKIFVGVVIFGFCIVMSEPLAKISLIQFNRKISEVSEALGIVLLVEYCFVSRFNKYYCLPAISIMGALCYGLVTFYRWNYLPISFFGQSVIFAIGVFGVLLVLYRMRIMSHLVSSTLIAASVFISVIYFGSWPQNSVNNIQISLSQTLLPIVIFGILAMVGIGLYNKSNKAL